MLATSGAGPERRGRRQSGRRRRDRGGRRYLREFPAYANADGIDQWPRVMPATSENIGVWRDFLY